MNHRFAPVLAVCSAAVLGGCSSASLDDVMRDPEPQAAPAPGAAAGALSALGAAHEAYLAGDFLALGERVRDVLLDPSAGDLVKENAYALLDKAYEAQHGKLPGRFVLPEGVTKIQYVLFRNMTPHGMVYDLRFGGFAHDASQVVGLTVRHLPDEILLDKSSGKGRFSTARAPGARKAGVEEFVIDSGPLDAPPPEGVMALRVELRDGTVTEGFIIAHDMASTATPEVLSPGPWASVAGPNPVVTWAPFRSPQCTSFEQRAMGVQVERDGGGGVLWEIWTGKPDEHHEARLGSPDGAGIPALDPGAYRVAVVAAEQRSFGPVVLARGSRTLQAFHVTP